MHRVLQTFASTNAGLGAHQDSDNADRMLGGRVAHQTTMRGFYMVAPDGSLASCQTPAMWKRRPVTPSLSTVIVDHFTQPNARSRMPMQRAIWRR